MQHPLRHNGHLEVQEGLYLTLIHSRYSKTLEMEDKGAQAATVIIQIMMTEKEIPVPTIIIQEALGVMEDMDWSLMDHLMEREDLERWVEEVDIVISQA